MKSFSSSSYANDHAAALEKALAKAKGDPIGLLTDGQWFLYAAKDVVFYHTYSRVGYDKAQMKAIVADMTELAPQLTWGYRGARPGQPLSDAELEIVTDVVLVDSFEGMPDSLMNKGADIFAQDDLPLFRVTAYVLKDGPDAAGRASLVNVRASHALLEGSDSALMTRSQSAGHGIMDNKGPDEGFFKSFTSNIAAGLITGMQIILGNTVTPKEPKPWGFRTLAFDRQRMRLLANRLGIRQRSLYFALVVYGLHGTGANKAFKKNKVRALYTLLDSEQTMKGDDFFRVTAQLANLEIGEDFVAFARQVDAKTGGVDPKGMEGFARIMSRGISMQRRLAKVFPKLFGDRFWSLGFGIDLGLTMVPPHRATGGLTRDVVEPIYCGAYHPGANAIAFCPGRRFITLSFTMEQRLIDNVDNIPALLDRVEQLEIAPASGAAAREQIDA